MRSLLVLVLLGLLGGSMAEYKKRLKPESEGNDGILSNSRTYRKQRKRSIGLRFGSRAQDIAPSAGSNLNYIRKAVLNIEDLDGDFDIDTVLIKGSVRLIKEKRKPPHGEASLTLVKTTIGNDVVYTGSMQCGDNVYQIMQEGDIVVVLEQSQEDFIREEEGLSSDELLMDVLSHDETEKEIPTGDDRGLLVGPVPRDRFGNVVIDVLVVFTREAVCGSNDEPTNCAITHNNLNKMKGLVNLAVKETNDAYQLSGIKGRIRAVCTEMIQFPESNDWPGMLNTLRYHNKVVELREKCGADFVSLLVKSSNSCGIGYVGRKEGAPSAAFSISQYGCATGYYSFGHEIAHNMGCLHDRRNAGTGGTFNFGYRDNSKSNEWENFRSIMSYACEGHKCPRVQRFSNIAGKFNGRRIGDGATDNARYIQLGLENFARYRETKIALTGPSATPAGGGKQNNAVTPPNPGPLKALLGRLATFFNGSVQGGPGNMFNVKAKQDLVVENFAVHAASRGKFDISVYMLNQLGSFRGFERVREKWKRIGYFTNVQAQGAGRPTELPKGAFEVPVKRGQMQAFYIEFSTTTNFNRYSQGSQASRNTPMFQNEALELFEGVANQPSFGPFYDPRGWNGVVIYKLVNGNSPIFNRPPPPTNPPTKPPTRRPLTSPPTKPPTPRPLATKAPTLRPLGQALHGLLSTLRNGGNGQAGNMFNVRAKMNVMITSYDIHTTSKDEDEAVEIYVRPGVFYGHENSENGWKKICDTKVRAQGTGEWTHVPQNTVTPIEMKPGEVWSFYVTLHSSRIRYSNGNRLGGIVSDTPQLTVFEGVGKSYKFGRTFSPRIWNGRMFFKVLNNATGRSGASGALPAPPSTMAPTKNPTSAASTFNKRDDHRGTKTNVSHYLAVAEAEETRTVVQVRSA
eukprot:CAMPEP_0118678302 /NCGR_PEP_ID=MMETSP0800-20121206/3136_1 /TAXON_ID=210618 ORGANISM="Striatella unipunctata, Strain CCMP2910" /NCGR_SAMPLE_ID=MMETSP0800 /ASSEMBLY_ACC=CAM_ASM_000638 /LENGTH=908 /DNA_ID=CAMNT_0006574129 /DNA_START=218 /DNA_END=2944 /DNA_ORIENTATION=-